MVRLKSKTKRMIKTGSEITKIKRAVRLTEKAIQYGVDNFKRGMTEKELETKILDLVLDRNLDIY